MKPVFADTSFYVALLNPEDVAHANALHVGHSIKRPVLLSDFILLELGNALSRGTHRPLFSRLADHLRRQPNVRIIRASRELLDRGLEFFARRPDKEWSLTDCTSFVVMRDEGLTDALTTDHHFEQAGFRVLLR